MIEVQGLQPNGAKPQRVEVLADTGATLTMLPSGLLEKAGVKPEGMVRVRTADGRAAERSAGIARVTVQGETTAVRVLFGEADDAALLGLTALEQVGLTVDPVNRKLVPTPFNLF
jgi:clan AA aspartic protease